MEALSLARLGKPCWKVTKSSMEQGGTLAPGTSLRLVVLAACLRGQKPESESLSRLCLLSIWIEALLLTMKILRTQIGNYNMWSDWKWYGLLLVVLALRRPEEALRWLLSQFLGYYFLWNLWKWIRRIGPSSLRTKTTFSSLANPLPSLFLYWCGNDSLLLLRSGLYSAMCTGTLEMDDSPSSTSLGKIWGKLLCYTLGSIREKGKSNKGLVVWN